MHRFKNSQSTDSRFLCLVASPRFLRAVPSVLLLTTAMAWGVSAQAAAPGREGASRNSAAASARASVDDGVRLGANDNVTAEQRAAAMQVAQGAVGAGTDAGATGSATSGQSRAVGGVRGTGQAAGGTAAPMGESAVGGVRNHDMGSMGGKSGMTGKGEVKADETGGLKGNVGSLPRKLDKAGRSGAAGADAGAGVGAGAADVNPNADVKAGAGVKGKSPAPY
ncbi:hypothetical protein [Polaromonas sp.]|uniref:hypothetical protein n=1 Tax=Polaromonas sp. TaxID=1869339 RepID=UPI0017BBB26F|nr:hypothetical protein [Polaromonas sp.]NMM07939.1 hypothetical protein [Polaromonas sp.]